MYFSVFHVYKDHLRILLKCRFWFRPWAWAGGREILHYRQAPGRCRGDGIPQSSMNSMAVKTMKIHRSSSSLAPVMGRKGPLVGKMITTIDSLKPSHWGLTNPRFNNYCGHQLLVSKLPKKKCTWPMIVDLQGEWFCHMLGQVLWPVMSKPGCPCPAFLGLLLVAKSCPTLCDPMDCNLPGSCHGISQARILEWVTFPSLGDLPDPGIEPSSPGLASGFLPSSHLGSPLFLGLPRSIKEVITEINTW